VILAKRTSFCRRPSLLRALTPGIPCVRCFFETPFFLSPHKWESQRLPRQPTRMQEKCAGHLLLVNVYFPDIFNYPPYPSSPIQRFFFFAGFPPLFVHGFLMTAVFITKGSFHGLSVHAFFPEFFAVFSDFDHTPDFPTFVEVPPIFPPSSPPPRVFSAFQTWPASNLDHGRPVARTCFFVPRLA